MTALLLALALSLLLAVAILGFVAYPHRGRRAPGPDRVSGALDRVGGRVTKVLEEVQPRR